MSEEPVKEFNLSGPGYHVSMDITKKGGKFFIDDKSGWRWAGGEDTFLTGLIRVAKSSMFDDFKKEIAESDIKKLDLKRAISHSLQKDRKDGLHPLLGDNRVREGWDSFTDTIWSEQVDEARQCLKHHGCPEENAKKIADDVVEHGTHKLMTSRQIFDNYEAELAKNFAGKKSWKETIADIVRTCDKTNKSVADFIGCITDTASGFKLDDPETQFERETEAWSRRYHVPKKDIKELSAKHNVPQKLLEECAYGRN